MIETLIKFERIKGTDL